MAEQKKRTSNGLFDALKKISEEENIDFGLDGYTPDSFSQKYFTGPGNIENLYNKLNRISEEEGVDFGQGSVDEWLSSFGYKKNPDTGSQYRYLTTDGKKVGSKKPGMIASMVPQKHDKEPSGTVATSQYPEDYAFTEAQLESGESAQVQPKQVTPQPIDLSRPQEYKIPTPFKEPAEQARQLAQSADLNNQWAKSQQEVVRLSMEPNSENFGERMDALEQANKIDIARQVNRAEYDKQNFDNFYQQYVAPVLTEERQAAEERAKRAVQAGADVELAKRVFGAPQTVAGATSNYGQSFQAAVDVERETDPQKIASATIQSVQNNEAFGDYVLGRMGIDGQTTGNGGESEPLNEEEKKYMQQLFSKEADEVADQMIQRIYDQYKEEGAPKTVLAYIADKAFRENFVNSLYGALVRRAANSSGIRDQLRAMASEEYGQNASWTTRMAGGAAPFAVDMLTGGFAAPAAVGNALVKGGMRMAAKEVTKEMGKRAAARGLKDAALEEAISGGAGIAERYLATQAPILNLALRSAGGAANFATYDVQSEAVRQLSEGEFNAGNLVKQAVHGATLGGILGVTGGMIANATRNSSLAKKVLADIAGVGAETGIFAAANGIEKAHQLGIDITDVDWADTTGEALGMVVGMKGVGTVMHPKTFLQRYRQSKDLGMQLTQRDIDELKAAGYNFDSIFKGLGEFGRMAPESATITRHAAEYTVDADGKRGQRNTETTEAYVDKDAFEAMLNNPEISSSVKRKLTFIATGRVLSLEPVFGASLDIDENGKAAITTKNAYGNTIETKEYESQEEAEKEYQAVKEMARTNVIVGLERIADKAGFQDVADIAKGRTNEETGVDVDNLDQLSELSSEDANKVLDAYIKNLQDAYIERFNENLKRIGEAQPAGESSGTVVGGDIPPQRSERRQAAYERGMTVSDKDDSLPMANYDKKLAEARMLTLLPDGDQAGFARQQVMKALEADDVEAAERILMQQSPYLSAQQREAVEAYIDSYETGLGVADYIQQSIAGYEENERSRVSAQSDPQGNVTALRLKDGSIVFHQSGELNGLRSVGSIFVVTEDGETKQISPKEVEEVIYSRPSEDIIAENVQDYASWLADYFDGLSEGRYLRDGQEADIVMGNQLFHVVVLGKDDQGNTVVKMEDGSRMAMTPEQTAEAIDAADYYKIQQTIQQEQEAVVAQQRTQRFNQGIVGHAEGTPDLAHKETKPEVAAEYLLSQTDANGQPIDRKVVLDGIQQEIDKVNDKKQQALQQIQQARNDMAMSEEGDEAYRRAELIINQLEPWMDNVDGWRRKWGEIRQAMMTDEERQAYEKDRIKTINTAKTQSKKDAEPVGEPTGTVAIPSKEDVVAQYPERTDGESFVEEQRKQLSQQYRNDVYPTWDNIQKRLDDYQHGLSDLSPEEVKQLTDEQTRLESLMSQMVAQQNAWKKLGNDLGREYGKRERQQMTPHELAMSRLEAETDKTKKVKLAQEAFKDDPDALAVLENLEPQDVYEHVAANLGNGSINWEGKQVGDHYVRGLRDELGKDKTRGVGSKYDTHPYNQFLAPEGQGKGIDEVVHNIAESSPYDPQDVKNALLSMLAEATKPTDISHRIVDDRIAQAEQIYEANQEREREAQLEAENEEIRRMTGLEPEEYEAFIGDLENRLALQEGYENSEAYFKTIENDDRTNERRTGGSQEESTLVMQGKEGQSAGAEAEGQGGVGETDAVERKQRIVSSLNKLAATYNSLPIVPIDPTISDRELVDLMELPDELMNGVTDEDIKIYAERIREHLKKNAASRMKHNNKIIVSLNIPERRVEEGVFHENTHQILEQWYGENAKAVAERFWENAPDEGGLVTKDFIKRHYDESEWPEEFFVTWLGKAMADGSVDDMEQYLPDDGDKQRINNILKNIGYDRTRETAARRENQEVRRLAERESDTFVSDGRGERVNDLSIQGLDGYTEKDVTDLVRQHFANVVDDSGVEVVDIKVIGSRANGKAKDDSDLDVLLEYKGDMREDDLFNILNDKENKLYIEDIPVDINPITEGKSGTIAEFLERNKDYQKEDNSFPARLARAKAETDVNPTEEQKKAGNYKMGHVRFGGYDMSIENPKGSTRSGVDANGNPWSIEMKDTYGYIRKKYGTDKDHLDFFINDDADLDTWQGRVFIVDQKSEDGKFDEHKVMYGYRTWSDARKAYERNYEPGWWNRHVMQMVGVKKDKFDKWLESSDYKTKPFASYYLTQHSETVTSPMEQLLADVEERQKPAVDTTGVVTSFKEGELEAKSADELKQLRKKRRADIGTARVLLGTTNVQAGSPKEKTLKQNVAQAEADIAAIDAELQRKADAMRQRTEQMEIGGAMVDQLENMGFDVTTNIEEMRKARKKAKQDNSEEGKMRHFETSDGQIYGFVYRGKMYLDPRKIDAELPIHEYAHPWCEAFRRLNPDGWKSIVDIMRNDKDTWEFVKQLNPDLTSDDDIAEEMIAKYSGEKGQQYAQAEYKRMNSKDPDYKSKWANIWKNISKAIQDFWKQVGDFLHIKYESAEQVYDQVVRDFANKINPRKRVEQWLQERDEAYMEAVNKGNMEQAKTLFDEALRENIGNGIVPFISAGEYRSKRTLAHAIKERDPKVIAEVADMMAPMIPKDAVLVPAPSHTGKATDMLDLANAISERTGAPVADVLTSGERLSQYDAKKAGKPLSTGEMGIVAATEQLPADKLPVVIDNVVDTGNTAEACVKALGKGIVASLADSADRYKHVASLKSAEPVVMDKNGNVVPLSKRFEIGGKYLEKPAEPAGEPTGTVAREEEPQSAVETVLNEVERRKEVANDKKEADDAVKRYLSRKPKSEWEATKQRATKAVLKAMDKAGVPYKVVSKEEERQMLRVFSMMNQEPIKQMARSLRSTPYIPHSQTGRYIIYNMADPFGVPMFFEKQSTAKYTLQGLKQMAPEGDWAIMDIGYPKDYAGLEDTEQRKAAEYYELMQMMGGNKKMSAPATALGEDSPLKDAVVTESDFAKVQNNLETLAKNTVKITNEEKNRFISLLAKAVGAKKHGSNSQYVTIEAKNGTVVTLRLADHNVTVSNFDYSGKPNGVSIVISRKPNEGIINDGNAHIVEYFYPDKELRKAEGSPYSEIVKSVEQMLYSGEYKDTTGIAQPEEVNNPIDLQADIEAWHGSGYTFTKFDHSNMGKGAGSQVFGWGTYLTSGEKIAEDYANSVAKRKYNTETPGYNGKEVLYKGEKIDLDQSKLDPLRMAYDTLNSEGTIKKAITFVDRLMDYAEEQDMKDVWQEVLNILKNSKKSDFKVRDADLTEKRFIYKVDIPEDTGDNYLDWMVTIKKPLRKKIADAVRQLEGEPQQSFIFTNYKNGWQSLADMIEREQFAYKEIHDRLLMAFGGRVKDAEKVSKLMNSLGFVGVKYPAGTIWGGGDGATNYVIFNEDDAKITDTIQFMIGDEAVIGPIFRSNAEIAVDGIKQEKATAEQWLAMLQKNGGLKAGEDKWLGLSEWLTQQKTAGNGSISKQDILDYIRQNQIQVEEVNYSNIKRDWKDEDYDSLSVDSLPEAMRKPMEALNKRWSELYHEAIKDADSPTQARNAAFVKLREEYGRDFDTHFATRDTENLAVRHPRYLQDAAKMLGVEVDIDNPTNETRLTYTTKGLENKREIALTVPTIEPWNEGDEIHFGDAGGGRAVAWIRFGDTVISDDSSGKHQAAQQRLKAYNSYLADKYGFDSRNPLSFDVTKLTPEEIAESDRLAAEYEKTFNESVKKVLVIDEIQSKRHQDARELGYQGEFTDSPKKQYEVAYDKLMEYKQELDEKYGEYHLLDQLTPEERAKYEEMYQKVVALSEVKDDKVYTVPDAPFEKNWHELAMKRMLRYAAENGYDKIAWTTGEQQAERYDIGGKVSWIQRGNDYGENPNNIYIKIGNATPDVEIDENGIIIDASSRLQESVGKPLGELVGKELAVKILNAKPGKENRIEGEDLRIGGEGMKGFYDEILPRFMNKYGKKWGIKVEKTELPDINQTMWSIDVTPEMKESVMEGQPMFQKEGKKLLGWSDGKQVYLTKDGLNPNTPLHECTHLWDKWCMKEQPELWKKLVSALKKTETWEQIAKNPNYRNIWNDDNRMASEVHSRLSGTTGEDEFMKAAFKKDTPQSIINEVKSALRKFWEAVLRLFTKHAKTIADDFESLQSIIRMPIRDLVNQDFEKVMRVAQDVTAGEAAGTVEGHIVEDKAEIARLESEPTEKGYRNVVVNDDGTLGSPMANRLGKKGEGRKATTMFEYDKWERSDEHPELATDDGKIDLIKPDGKTVEAVDYNPYIHIRPNKVNKQFKQAWERPNLIYVETEYPKSELNGEYQAEKAAKAVGKHKWGTQGEYLILSRWDKPIRMVPWEEVADDWVAEFKNRGVEFDIIPPKLLPLLAERGVKILPPHKGMGKACNEAYEHFLAGQTSEHSERAKMIFDAVKNLFGTTHDIREAGYVLPDGSMPDFSGRHSVDKPSIAAGLRGQRTVDHRDVKQIAYEKDGSTETGLETTMPEFIKSGAIRIDYEAGNINLATKPTDKQRAALRQIIVHNDGYVQVDFGDGWDSDHYVEYDGAKVARVLSDIDRYFDEGVKPQGDEGLMRSKGKRLAKHDTTGFAEAAEAAGDQLGGVKVKTVSYDEADDKLKREIEAGTKGIYNPNTGEVTLLLDNIEDVDEAVRTVFHEKLGHEGLVAMLGSQEAVNKFGTFVFRSAKNDVRKRILDKANENDGMWEDGARYSKAAQEVLADIAAEGPRTADEFDLWTKVKHYLIRLLNKIGLRIRGLLNDKDLAYYIVKTGEALKKWNAMSDEARQNLTQQASSHDIMRSRGGKPRQKKGESMAQYFQRLREWEKWRAARQTAKDNGDPEPEEQNFHEKAEADFKADLQEWKERNNIPDGEPSGTEAFPKREDGESPQEYAVRVAEYEANKDMWETAPNLMDYLARANEAYRQAYTEWRERYDLQEQESVDQKLYEGDIDPTPTFTDADMEAEAMAEKDLADALGMEIDEAGAKRMAKLAVIERRKDMESANAEDAIWVYDFVKMTDEVAKDLASQLQDTVTGKELRAALPFLIEADRRRENMEAEKEDAVMAINMSEAIQQAHSFVDFRNIEQIGEELNALNAAWNYKENHPSGDADQRYRDAAARLANKLNDLNKDMDGYNKLFADDVMQIRSLLTHASVAGGGEVMPAFAEKYAGLPEVQQLMSHIKDWYDEFYQVLEDAGLRGDAGYIDEGYVNHVWDKEKSDPKAWEQYIENRQRTKSPNMRHREIDTYMDGISIGLVPKYTDIADMIAHYSRQNNEAVANSHFLNDLKFVVVQEMNDAGEVTAILPLLMMDKPETLLRDKYAQYYVPGVGDVYVLKHIQKRFANIFGTMRTPDAADWLSKLGKAYDLTSSTAKKIQLALSGFHALALFEVDVAQNNPAVALKHLFKYIITDSIKSGTLPAYAHPEDFQLAAKHLVQLGATEDYAAADVNAITQKIRDAFKEWSMSDEAWKKAAGTVGSPAAIMMDWLNKGFDTVLWNYLHDGLKLCAFKELAKQVDIRVEKEGLDEKTREQLLDEAGQYVNDMFGGQYWELINISPATLKWMRRAFLSPDWLISTQRHFFANFGFGSVYSDGGFREYIKYNADNIKRLCGADVPRDELRRLRSKNAKYCYLVGAMLWWGIFYNAINALCRWKDEEDEKAKAEEERKTNPQYKSPYELAYPDGMKWYDYTMYGNTVGQQTHLFTGRYSDGTETYVRWGKQFREFPELFMGRHGAEFPAPMIQRMMAKANPNVGTMIDFLGAQNIGGFNGSYENKELREKYGKTVATLAAMSRHFIPFGMPTQAEKEYKWLDFFMPSSKGFSRWKAKDYFETFIMDGDWNGIEATYKACVMNGVDAEAGLKAAIASIKATHKKELADGATDLSTASMLFDAAEDPKDKVVYLNKIKKYLKDGDYKAFTKEEAIEMVNEFVNGEDVADKDRRFVMLANSEDIIAEEKLRDLGRKAKQYKNELERKKNSPEYDQMRDRYDSWLRIDKKVNKAIRAINKSKKQLGALKEDSIMNDIRETIKQTIADIDKLEAPE